jgi:hypothetical protein
MKASEMDNAEDECKDLYDITASMFPWPSMQLTIHFFLQQLSDPLKLFCFDSQSLYYSWERSPKPNFSQNVICIVTMLRIT